MFSEEGIFPIIPNGFITLGSTQADGEGEKVRHCCECGQRMCSSAFADDFTFPSVSPNDVPLCCFFSLVAI